MDVPVLQAFVLCDEISDSASRPGQKDLRGAGLSVIHATNGFPIKHTFWVYIELVDEKSNGSIGLELLRADSGRTFSFRDLPVQFSNRLETINVAVRLFNCEFPTSGVYFVELWYD